MRPDEKFPARVFHRGFHAIQEPFSLFLYPRYATYLNIGEVVAIDYDSEIMVNENRYCSVHGGMPALSRKYWPSGGNHVHHCHRIYTFKTLSKVEEEYDFIL